MYEFFDLPVGVYRIEAKAENLETVEADLQTEAGEVVTKDITSGKVLR